MNSTGVRTRRKTKRNHSAVTCKEDIYNFTKAVDANYFLGHIEL